jgi:hypothetical protein
MSTTTSSPGRMRFFEGGNTATVISVPCVFLGALIFYPKVVTWVRPLDIQAADVYSYVFNLFAIEFGALIGLFALFTCKPTAFLERIKNTQTFASIVANTRITMTVATIAIFATFILGILRINPEQQLTIHSVVFVAWIALSVAATLVYVRTIRLILTALV